jgi:hypothetical protein
MKKIAFLFLVIDNPNFTKIWNKYFKGHVNKYNIYIHPKNYEKTIWKKKNIISKLKNTEWGFITKAYLELLKEAYKDKDNYKFITISESCIPIQPFDIFYEDAINDERSWIKSMKISYYDYKVRINTQLTKPKPIIFLKNYARFCLNRSHVKKLISKEKELEFFHKMHVGDEFFLTVLYPLKNVKNFAVIYDDWDYVKKKGYEIKEKIKKLNEEKNLEEIKKLQNEYNNIMKNPKLIIKVEEDLEKIKKCESYFYRKFDKNSNIEKYWEEIMDYHVIKH